MNCLILLEDGNLIDTGKYSLLKTEPDSSQLIQTFTDEKLYRSNRSYTLNFTLENIKNTNIIPTQIKLSSFNFGINSI